MDENIISQLFIAFKEDLVPEGKRNPKGICEAYKQFRETAQQVLAGKKTPFKTPRGPRNKSDIITKNF